MQTRIRKFLLWLGGWGLVSLFYTLAHYFAYSRVDEAPSVWIALRNAMAQWYAWGLLSLLIIRVDRWIAAGRSLRQRLLWHLPLSVLVTGLFWLLVMFLDRRWYNGMLTGSGDEPLLSLHSLRLFLGVGFQATSLYYWLIAGSWMAWDYHRESQARKLHAAQLEQRLAESRLLNLKAQLHPHFLFNALNAISAFVEKDPRRTRQMIEHLGDLLRFSLEHSAAQETTLATELRALEHYLAIQRVRFEDHLRVQMDIAPETLPATAPSLILQPLVENAIRHSVAHETRPVCVTIRAAKEREWLRLQISDDGPGLPAQWTFDEHAGVGLTNTKLRLEQLYPAAHEFAVNNSASGGVTVNILLPFHSNGVPSKTFGEKTHDTTSGDHRG